MERKAEPKLTSLPHLVLVTSIGLLLVACGSREAPSAAAPLAPPPPSLVMPPSPPPTPSPPQEIKSEAPVYRYDPKGRRDPFQPPPQLSPKPPSKGKSGLAGLEVTDLKLAGIVWEQTDYYALVEAPNGLGYILREGAILGEGTRVVKVTKDSVVFEVKGRLPREETRMVTLRLRKEE